MKAPGRHPVDNHLTVALGIDDAMGEDEGTHVCDLIDGNMANRESVGSVNDVADLVVALKGDGPGDVSGPVPDRIVGEVAKSALDVPSEVRLPHLAHERHGVPSHPNPSVRLPFDDRSA